jgi:hypothetical protein
MPSVLVTLLEAFSSSRLASARGYKAFRGPGLPYLLQHSSSTLLFNNTLHPSSGIWVFSGYQHQVILYNTSSSNHTTQATQVEDLFIPVTQRVSSCLLVVQDGLSKPNSWLWKAKQHGF